MSARTKEIKLRHRLEMEAKEIEWEREQIRMTHQAFCADPELKYFLVVCGGVAYTSFLAIMNSSDPAKQKQSGESWEAWLTRIGIAVALPPGLAGIAAQISAGKWSSSDSTSLASLGLTGWAGLCLLLRNANIGGLLGSKNLAGSVGAALL